MKTNNKKEFIAKGERLIRYHRQNVFSGTEKQQDRHTSAIDKIKKILDKPWREDRPSESKYCRVMWM